MIAVRIPKEIRDYKEKILAGLTARQVVALIVMIPLGIAIYRYSLPAFGKNMAENLVCIVLTPIGLLGFFPYKHGMKPEVWFKLLIRFYFIVPKKRKFVSKNHFDFRKTKIK